MSRRGVAAPLTAAMAGLLVVCGAVACGEDGSDGLPPAPSPGASTPAAAPKPQLTPEEQQAVDEVRRLFDEFMQAYVDLATSGDPPSDNAMLLVLRFLDPPLYSSVNTELVDNYLGDRRMDGTLVWRFVGVSDIDLDRVVDDRDWPKVDLMYCIDATVWTPIDKVTADDVSGSPVFGSGTHLGTVRATYFDPFSSDDANPQWYLGSWDGELRSC
jgi:hypothetical protein